MASTYTDSMALRQSIEVPTDHAGRETRDTTKERSHRTFEEDVENTIDMLEAGQPPSKDNCARDRQHDTSDSTITLSSTNKVAGKTVAPFLARHIPEQYAPQGIQPKRNDISEKDALRKNPNTKYCYRHRPDSKCRRTADEPTMENLQRDLATLTHADQQGISHVWSLFSAAPAKQRNLMLQGILAQCCFPQLSYLSTTVRDLIRIDFISALPSEISFKILCYLDTTSLCKAAQVSQKWRILADDDVVWHKMCEQHIDRKCQKCGWGLPLLERKLLRDWKRQQQLRGTGRGLNEWSPRLTPVPDQNTERSLVKTASLNGCGKRTLDTENLSPTSPDSGKRQRLNVEESLPDKPKFRPWKDVYKDRFRVGTNWKYGRYSTKVFQGHTNGVMCLQFDDNMLATGSYDATIKIWDISTGRCLRTLVGHTSGVRTLQFDDSKLISGSLDHTVRVWNWRTGDCISTMYGHTGGVIGVHFDGNLLASGSVDKSIRIWNFENKMVFVLPGGRNGHDNWVNSIKVDSASRTVFSASDDCTIRLWDLDTRETIQLFEGHVGQVQQVTLMPAEYEPDDIDPEDDDSASSAGGSPEAGPQSPGANSNPSPFDSWPEDRPRPARYIVTGALDSTVRLWNVNTGKCLKTFFGHVEGVWAVAADTLRVVSGAEDRLVKVWDARTGKCEKTYTGHAGAVTCIGLSDSKLITGGEDCEVRMQSFKSEDGEQSFDGDAGCSTRST